MNLNRRLSFLATTTLCALPVLFPTESAAAPKFDGILVQDSPNKKKEKSVGTVKIEGGGSVRINGKTAGNGAAIAIGDTIVTGRGASVKLTLSSGKEYIIDAGSRIKLLDDGKGGVRLLVVYGGSHPAEGSNESIDPLPYIGAFGFGNFPAGGGGNSSNGNVVSRVLPGGQIAFYDSAGNFIR